MKLNQYQCDLCHDIASLMSIFQARIVKGREMDASGNGYNDVIEHKDICSVCLNNILTEYFENK